jgi:hypothetical protein
MADELDAWADGRFVHRFSLNWPWYEEFAIECDDAAMSLHALGRVLDFGEPEALAALEETVALLRQRVAGAPGDNRGQAWYLDDLSRRLADLRRSEEALAASEEAAALDP